jgi:hypothetical protein
MPKRIRIRVGDVTAEAELFEDKAPNTIDAFWERLPMLNERTIQVRWSGDAWRTEGDYELLTKDDEIENRIERLAAGDVAYYPGYHSGNFKICFAYGKAQWLAPFMVPVATTTIGKIDVNLDAFVAASQRIIFDGPLDVEITRIEG